MWFDVVSIKYARTSSDLATKEPNSTEMGAILIRNLVVVLVCTVMGAISNHHHYPFDDLEGFVVGVAHEADVDVVF